MKMSLAPIRSACIASLTGLMLAFGIAVSATAMTVQPVIVDLTTSGSQGTALVSVENSGKDPLPVELRVTEANFIDTGLTPSDRTSEDILVFPPQALIPPGETQSFRLQYLGDPGLAKSRHFFVTVAQLPVKLPEGTSAIQIVYNFNVIVSVAAPGAKPDISVVSGQIAKSEDGKPVAGFTVRNAGETYDYLINGRLRFVQKDAAGKEIFRKTLAGDEIQQIIGFGLIGPEVTRTFATSIELPSAEGTLNVEFTPERRR
jgi:fimbrial chaperone protein